MRVGVPVRVVALRVDHLQAGAIHQPRDCRAQETSWDFGHVLVGRQTVAA